jgi:hypothetical protein
VKKTHKEIMDTFIGEEKSYIISFFGSPDRTSSDGEGGKTCVWDYSYIRNSSTGSGNYHFSSYNNSINSSTRNVGRSSRVKKEMVLYFNDYNIAYSWSTYGVNYEDGSWVRYKDKKMTNWTVASMSLIGLTILYTVLFIAD